VEQFVNFTDEQGGLLGLKILFSIFIGKVRRLGSLLTLAEEPWPLRERRTSLTPC
jgi:hypothetical protein